MPALHRLDRALDRLRAGRAAGQRARRIVTLGAWATHSGAIHVEGRVLSSPLHAHQIPRGLRRAWALMGRLESDEVPGVRVAVDSKVGSAHGVTDEEGYFSIELPVTTASAVHAPHLLLEVRAEGMDAPVSMRATVAGAHARRVVISDVDDTVLVAHATSRLRQAYHLLLSPLGGREAVPHAAALYRALAHGGIATRAQHNPIAYVSSAPTNVAEVIETSLVKHGFPSGPLFLKDFGVDEKKTFGESHVAHKVERIARVLAAWPSHRVLLVGDTGQSDPAVFAHVAERWPDRIEAAWLRDAPGGDPTGADEALARVSSLSGAETLRFAHVLEAAAWARDRGWIVESASLG